MKIITKRSFEELMTYLDMLTTRVTRLHVCMSRIADVIGIEQLTDKIMDGE